MDSPKKFDTHPDIKIGLPKNFDTSHPDHDVIPNTQLCDYCEGGVDRLIVKGSWQPENEQYGQTICFQCNDCGAKGDPFTGMMVQVVEKILP